MKIFQILFIFSLIIMSCDRSDKKIENSAHNYEVPQANLPVAVENKQSLVLSDDALQLVDLVSGTIYELPYGTPQGQLTEIINEFLASEAENIGVNTECGGGPLKMLAWSNGLNLVFQENNTINEGKPDWVFQGWYINSAKENSKMLTTMAGVGIGSTLADLQSAYEIKIKKTRLGQEFTTASGLSGILDGTGQDAKVIHLWSGLVCNFR